MTPPRRILLLADFYRNSAATIRDHATSLARFSTHDFHLLNPVGRTPPTWLDLRHFDAVVIHFSIHTLYSAHLGDAWISALAAFPGVKAVFLQDEYRTIHAFHSRMRELKVNLLLTCVPEPEIEKVYPATELPGLRRVPVLTGYVPDELAALPLDLDSPRPLDVGYRARDGNWWLGDLFREKYLIAKGFLDRQPSHGLRCDISTREEDRIYGPAWTAFLRRSRFTLGTESGANVFDFTGEIQREVLAFLAKNPQAAYAEVHQRFLAEDEGKVRLNQISPRIWESTALGCGLVLFPGEYSGLIQPDRHYIPLEKDFSNFDQVVERMRDEEERKAMVRRAHQDLIASGAFTYRLLAERFDQALEEVLETHPWGTEARPPLPERSSGSCLFLALREAGTILLGAHPTNLRGRLRNLYYGSRSHPELLRSEWNLSRGNSGDQSPGHSQG